MDSSKSGQALSEMPHAMKLARRILPCLPMALLLNACGGQLLDVGSNTHDAGGSSNGGNPQPSAGTSTTSGSGGATQAPSGIENGAGSPADIPQDEPQPLLPWPDATSCVAGSSPLTGSWSGYVQGQGDEYNFVLDLAGSDDAPCGTIRFGEPRQYPAATDPEAGYLPGDESHKNLQLAAGFTYTLLAVQADVPRLRFRVSFAEPYASWCGLQTSYPEPDSEGYTCVQDYGSGAWHTANGCYQKDSEGNQHPVSCTQYGMCESIDPPCQCQADGCEANVEGSGPYFDLHFAGTAATGEMSDQQVFLEKD
jgi:hypothetical protein